MRSAALALLAWAVLCPLVFAQSGGLQVLPQAVEMRFPQGYEVYSDAGKLLKTVPGPTSATVQAKTTGKTFAVGEVYLSDWSYDHLQQGKLPNWIVPKSNVAADAVSQGSAPSGDPTGLVIYPAIKEVSFPEGYNVFNDDGQLIKTVPGPTSIALKGETSGKTFANGIAYLSDWSYEQLQQGKSPNWVVSNWHVSNSDETSMSIYTYAIALANNTALRQSTHAYKECLDLLNQIAVGRDSKISNLAQDALLHDPNIAVWHARLSQAGSINFPLSKQHLLAYAPTRGGMWDDGTRLNLYAKINGDDPWLNTTAPDQDVSARLMFGSHYSKLNDADRKDLNKWTERMAAGERAREAEVSEAVVIVNPFAGLKPDEEEVGCRYIARAYGPRIGIFDRRSGVLLQSVSIDHLVIRGRDHGCPVSELVFSGDEEMLAFFSGLHPVTLYVYQLSTCAVGRVAASYEEQGLTSLFGRKQNGELTFLRAEEIGADVSYWKIGERSSANACSDKNIFVCFNGFAFTNSVAKHEYDNILSSWRASNEAAEQQWASYHKRASRPSVSAPKDLVAQVNAINTDDKITPRDKEKLIVEKRLSPPGYDTWTTPRDPATGLWNQSVLMDSSKEQDIDAEILYPFLEQDFARLGDPGWGEIMDFADTLTHKTISYDLVSQRWFYSDTKCAPPSTSRITFFDYWNDLQQEDFAPSLAWRNCGVPMKAAYRGDAWTNNDGDFIPRKYESEDGEVAIYSVFFEASNECLDQALAVRSNKTGDWIALPDLDKRYDRRVLDEAPSKMPFILPYALSLDLGRQHYYDRGSKTLYIASEFVGLFTLKLGDLPSLRLLSGIKLDGNFAVSGDDVFDGKSLWSLSRKAKIVDIIRRDKGRLCLVTPDLFYSGPGAKDVVSFRVGANAYPFEQFDLRLNRPDIVLERLGAPVDAVAIAKQLREKRLKRMGVTEEMLKPDFHVPELEIVGDIPATTDAGELNLSIKASDSKYPLERLKVYVNNVPVNGRDGELLREDSKSGGGGLLGRITGAIAGATTGPQSLERTIPIKLAAGRNKIQVSVLNNAGAESLYANAEVNCTARRPKPTLYAVAMGVSEYSNADWNLKYAAKDARDVLARLKDRAGDQYGAVKELLLTDKDVTKENLAKVRDFLKDATIDDTVLMFAAGHGLLDTKYDYYFGTTDIDFKNPSDKGIAFEEFDDILADLPCLKKSLLVDTCHAGELDQDEKALLASADSGGSAALTTGKGIAMRSIGTRGMNVKAIEGAMGASEWYDRLQGLFVDLRRGSGSTILTSAAGAEYALESSEQQNGLFTYAVLEALDGKKEADTDKDGLVQMSELGEYVKKRVSELTNNKQTPNTRRVNLEGDFSVAKTR